ncbi:MAG: GNAT family N-acetyltransferase [Epibacterium sp.]|nr:GNAT family N-acetyltransferase [Epibacterium sp.]
MGARNEPMTITTNVPCPVTLRSIRPDETGRFASQLANYLAEVRPEARLDVMQRAGQLLNRRDTDVWWLVDQATTVGFAVVLKLPDDRRELSEFTIFPQYRRKGLGKLAAQHVLETHRGHWRMGISRKSHAAIAFWGTCLSLLPNIEDLRSGAAFAAEQEKSFTFVIGSGAVGPN